MQTTHDLAYVLHAVHYQETSAIVRLLTQHHGLVSGVLRGVYQSTKKSLSMRAAIQMGNRIECEWSGKSSLKTFYRLEQIKALVLADTQKFVCLTYVNELLMHFLQENIAVDAIFLAYEHFLERLMQGDVESALREFELDMLEDLGYGMDFSWDYVTSEPVCAQHYYRVIPGEGVRLALEEQIESVSGKDLLSINRRDFSSPVVLQSAKKINRKILAYHMDNKPLKARAMYADLFIR